MTHTISNDRLVTYFTPRWTWRPVIMAGVVTLAVYLLLPYLETLSAPPEKNASMRSVNRAVIASPPPPPPRVEKKQAEAKPKAPKPEIEQLRQKLAPMQAVMNLNMAMGDVGGDFSVDFGVTAGALDDQLKELIFEISDLDESPRPLARLKPVYPPQASMRKIEGLVVVEFVVAADGTPRDIVVISSQPGDVFTAAAIRAIQRWRFSPGTKAGNAVAARVRQKVEFKLD